MLPNLIFVPEVNLDNTGAIVIRAFGRIPETIDAIIACDISNDWAYFFLQKLNKKNLRQSSLHYIMKNTS